VLKSSLVLLALSVSSIGCTALRPGGPCAPVDPVLADSAFVVVVEPAPGQRVRSPFDVHGCSRAFESNVVWELRARDGRTLDSGHATGGGAAGAGELHFAASFRVAEPQLGHLEVFAPEVSETEGFPGGRSVIPVVLLP